MVGIFFVNNFIVPNLFFGFFRHVLRIYTKLCVKNEANSNHSISVIVICEISQKVTHLDSIIYA